MRGSYPKAPEIRRLMAARGLTTVAQLAALTGLDVRVVSKLLHGGKPVELKSLQQAGKALGLGDDFSSLIAATVAESKGIVDSGLTNPSAPPSTVLRSLGSHERRLQDNKVIVTSRMLSERFLAGETPSLHEAVLGSAVVYPISDAHKDHPSQPGWTYNHFLSVAVVVLMEDQTARTLGHHRQPVQEAPSQFHTQGVSILFAASPALSARNEPRQPLDDWIEICESRPEDATRELLQGKRPRLLDVLRWKLDLRDCHCRLTPLGVVTNDQRDQGYQRVYTHFVFTAQVPSNVGNLDLFVSSLRVNGRVCRIPNQIDPEQVFVGKQNRPNCSDIAVWRAIHSRERTVEYRSARFVRGFPVCDEAVAR